MPPGATEEGGQSPQAAVLKYCESIGSLRLSPRAVAQKHCESIALLCPLPCTPTAVAFECISSMVSPYTPGFYITGLIDETYYRGKRKLKIVLDKHYETIIA